MLRRDGSDELLRVLITVKTYPTPSKKYIETVCTAGVTEEGEFVRLYPVPFRLLAGDRQFRKFDWVTLHARRKLADRRPESYALDEQTIAIEGHVGTESQWRDRRARLAPLLVQSVEELRERQACAGQSLGLVRPAEITRFTISRTSDEWTDREWVKLTQQDLFRHAPAWTLQKLPWEFRYEFRCDDSRCDSPHRFQVFDWEIGESYRQWSAAYGPRWQEKMEQKYMDELARRRDLQFFLGTIAKRPKTWTIVGLFYPPARRASDMEPKIGTLVDELLRNNRTVAQLGLPFEAQEAHTPRT